MRTTLDIEDDVLAAAKELARLQSLSAGQVISRLAREALAGRRASESQSSGASVAGFRPFASRGKVVTNEQVDGLRDREGV